MKYLGFLLLAALIVGGWFVYSYYYVPAYSQGEQAPNFDMQLLDGRSFDLDKLRGHYVLLDFWGSWCGPCRQENPKLVALYDKYNPQLYSDADGFEIVSIGLETSRERWQRAIEKDGLHWPYHHADFERMKSPIADLYGVRSIPATFLISPQGQIIGVNLPIHRLDDILSSKVH